MRASCHNVSSFFMNLHFTSVFIVATVLTSCRREGFDDSMLACDHPAFPWRTKCIYNILLVKMFNVSTIIFHEVFGRLLSTLKDLQKFVFVKVQFSCVTSFPPTVFY
ncbi:uncharacterized protein LOC125191624 [Salvia hispanica]|uniref:uncharacterized protein LOC125191624 n=1 Tax=Salvia hispanica TaxID=49212 RepID=UPI002009AACF|nr:uncharacterized protein LOC125191624 [Salvia hispanica]